MRKLVLALLFLTLPGSAAEGAGRSWSGTWRDARGNDPSSELRTIDHGNGDVEFQSEIWGGPPAHNSGGVEGHLSVTNGTATFETTKFDGVCRIDFSFADKQVVIRQTKGSWAECGFGHSIVADGTFKRINRKVPRFVRR